MHNYCCKHFLALLMRVKQSVWHIPHQLRKLSTTWDNEIVCSIQSVTKISVLRNYNFILQKCFVKNIHTSWRVYTAIWEIPHVNLLKLINSPSVVSKRARPSHIKRLIHLCKRLFLWNPFSDNSADWTVQRLILWLFRFNRVLLVRRGVSLRFCLRNYRVKPCIMHQANDALLYTMPKGFGRIHLWTYTRSRKSGKVGEYIYVCVCVCVWVKYSFFFRWRDLIYNRIFGMVLIDIIHH